MNVEEQYAAYENTCPLLIAMKLKANARIAYFNGEKMKGDSFVDKWRTVMSKLYRSCPGDTNCAMCKKMNRESSVDKSWLSLSIKQAISRSNLTFKFR